MHFFYSEPFRELVIWAAIVLLMVFCWDKSRQNHRTRAALYNCVYPLYGAALTKGVLMLDVFFNYSPTVIGVGIVLSMACAVGYWWFFKPQRDIPFNGLFRAIGWVVIIFVLILQVCFLVFS